MSNKIKAIVVGIIVLLSGIFMSFVGSNTTNIVSTSFEKEIIETAAKHGYLSTSEGQMFRDNHVIQQCVDTFISSGYKPSVAIDKMAEIGVSSKKFKIKAQAKQEIKQAIEKARKEEATWKEIYNILGL